MSNEEERPTVRLSNRPGTVKELALVVAIGRNRVIGRKGKLPWHIAEDMRHFKQVTLGHAVIMGRKTSESIGRPLPERTNIVVTSNVTNALPGYLVAPSFEAALERAWQIEGEPRVIGGSSLYAAAWPLATRVYLTRVDREIEGDTFFPDVDWAAFEERESRAGEEPGVTFVELARKST